LSAGYAVSDPVFDYYGKPFKAQRCIGAIESDSVLMAVKAMGKEQVLELYPNPVSRVLNVVIPSKAPFSIEIFNALGECVFKVENINQIDVEALKTGIYWVKLTQEGKLCFW
jgi:hypothetical protein